MAKHLLVIALLAFSLAISSFLNLSYLTGNTTTIASLFPNAAIAQSDSQNRNETTSSDECGIGIDTNHPAAQGASSNSSETIDWPDMLIVDVEKSREITITSQEDSSSFPMEGTMQNKVLMTIGNVTIRSEENTVENIPKRKGFVSAYINYTLENLENRAFYPHVEVDALVDGARYPCQLCGGGDTSSILLPHEKRYNMWTAFQVPDNSREITFDIIDVNGQHVEWSLPVNVTIANGVPVYFNNTAKEETAPDVADDPVNDTADGNNSARDETEGIPAQPMREPVISHLAIDEAYQQKQITIQNFDSSIGVTQNDAILVLENATLYSDGDTQYMPYNPGYNILIVNYSIANIDDNPYFVQMGFEAHGSSQEEVNEQVTPDDNFGKADDGNQGYGVQEIGWPFGNQILPNEMMNAAIGVYVPDEETDITINVIDRYSEAAIWTIPLKISDKVVFPNGYGNTSRLPDDFAVTYSYGIGLDYTLDTEKGIFTVKTCDDPALQNVTLALSDEELLKIWQVSAENDFMNMGDFTELCPSDAVSGCSVMTPASQTVLTISANDRSNTILFGQNYEINHSIKQYPEFAKYKTIVDTIDGMLAKYENKLPDSKCAYL